MILRYHCMWRKDIFLNVKSQCSLQHNNSVPTSLQCKNNQSCHPSADPPKNVSVSISPPGYIAGGSSVTLTCSSDANPPVDEYHWFKETLLVGKGKGYTISNISSETAGEYKCKCVNAEGHKYSAGVTVNLIGPPKNVSVSISPSGNIVEGSSVTLTCSSAENPPVKNYTWFKEGGASPVGSGHSYSITSITAEHTGLYYCEARNELGRQMASAALSLYPEHSYTAVLVTVGLVCLAAVIIVCLVYLMIRRAKRRGQNVPPAADELDLPDCGSKWSDAFQALPIAALSKPYEGNNPVENMYAAAEDVHVDLNATCLSFDDTCNALDETYVLPVNEPHDGDPLYANVSTNPADDDAHMAHDEDGSHESPVNGREVSQDDACSFSPSPFPHSADTSYDSLATPIIIHTVRGHHNSNQTDYRAILFNTWRMLLDPPKNVLVSISPPGYIAGGSSVTLTCSSDANPPVKTYTWFKEKLLVGRGKDYTISNISSETAGEYKCKCVNAEGHKYSAGVTVNLIEHSYTAVFVTVGLVCLAAVIIVYLVYLMIRRAKRRGQGALSKPYEGNSPVGNMYAAAEVTHVDLNATCLSFDDTRNALDETYVLPVDEPHDGDPLYANVSTNPADGAHMAHDEDRSHEVAGELLVQTVVDYALDFRTVTARSGWNNPALLTVFRKGLNPDICRELACQDDGLMPDELISLTIRLDQLKHGASTGSHQTSVPRFPQPQPPSMVFPCTCLVPRVTPESNSKEPMQCKNNHSCHSSADPPKNVLVSISPPGYIAGGSSVTLTCSSVANPPVDEYHWFKEKLLVGKGKDYTISNISPETAGEYKCKCFSAEGHQYSAGVTVNLIGPPKNVSVSISLAGKIVEESSVTLTCSSDGIPPVKNYTWFRGSTPVGKEQTYNIPNIRFEDSGEYTCHSRNEHGERRSTAVQINVLYPPKNVSVYISPSGDIAEDSTVTLTCSSDANPPVKNYTWFKEGGASPVGSGHSYSITNITAEHTGLYYCEARNELGRQMASAALSLYPEHSYMAVLVTVGLVCGAAVIIVCLVYLMIRRAKRRGQEALSKPYEGNSPVQNMYAAAEVGLNATCLSLDDTRNALETCVSPVDEPHDGYALYALEHPHTVPADGAVGVEGHQFFWTCDDKPFILVLTTVPPHTDSLGVSTKTKVGLVTEDDPLPF
ncbi:hypothetical protein NFI96_004650 [Prochilodus magdalenae]|nr:hypothetical protein NFI96_004650 [Prochilodus magdalenae]